MENVRDNLKPLPWRRKHTVDERANRKRQRLPLVGRGLLDEFLDEQHLRGWVPDPSDPKNVATIAEFANCTEDEARTYGPLIAPFFEQISPGLFVNPELERERTEKDAFRVRQAQFGKQGGRGNKKSLRGGHKASLSEPEGLPIETLSEVEGSAKASLSEPKGLPIETLSEVEGSAKASLSEPKGCESQEEKEEELEERKTPPMSPKAPYRSVGSNGEFMLAVGLLQDLKLAATTGDIGVVAQVITLEGPEHGGEAAATEFIKKRAFEARSRGELVTVFWIKDRKFAQIAPCAIRPHSNNDDVADEYRREQLEIYEQYLRWESCSEKFKTENPWIGAIPEEITTLPHSGVRSISLSPAKVPVNAGRPTSESLETQRLPAAI